ncbi:AAA family ATPase [Sulfurisphaera tokodaii]|uniref:Endonuclease GajA/Old nuclease/RecF-like AAA domain-containing protein n=2 Tax=Sulfurisphaera tokodaii TaxID=111955 RepID=Q972I6_SULTO|nr:AAA family ATPase [Sulfurisphaera tokodaii]BAB66180.1 hypothetical protein STK_11450 [Sulfurisphaera tokodaii str. 7]HII73027.1 ATP-binding protein [Sulfurisphaera tokodaii]
MRIKVENFGPIQNAEFELGDTTIVIGPNASGKSFLSYLLYSLFSSGVNIDDVGSKVIDSNSKEFEIGSYIDVINEVLSNSIKRRLEEVFGVNVKKLISFGAKESRIELTNSLGTLYVTITDKFQVEMKVNRQISVNLIERTDSPHGSISIGVDRNDKIKGLKVYYGSALPFYDEETKKRSKTDLDRNLTWRIADVLLRLFFEVYHSTVILPTERNVVLSNLFSYLSQQRNLNKPIIKEFIDSLLSVINLMDLSEKRELNVSMGKINFMYKVGKPILIEVFDRGEEVPLSLLSSGYSQLIPIHLMAYLGEFMIIEEPELNLHAGAQIDIANYLSDLVMSGKKFFLTTHSDIFTIQIAVNYVKRLKGKTLKIYLLNEGKIEEIKYTEKGDVEEIPTISDAIRQQVKEIYGE